MKVVNTRPRQQAGELNNLLEQAGFQPVSLPLTEIKWAEFLPAQKKRYQQLLGKASWLIVISKNAVNAFCRNFAPEDYSLQIATTGMASAKHWQQQTGRKADLVPLTSGSEAVLAQLLPRLQAAQAARDGNTEKQALSIVIARGEHGREYLARQLRQQGFVVDYIPLYQRIDREYSADDLGDFWQQHHPQIVLISSSESARHWLRTLQNANLHQWLQLPILTLHARIAQKLKALAYPGKVYVSDGADNQALIKALQGLNF